MGRTLISSLAVLLPLIRAEPGAGPSLRQARQFSNLFGVRGHEACMSSEAVDGEKRIGHCYNEVDCILADGGNLGGACPEQPGGNLFTGKGSCCVMTNKGACGQMSSSKLSYFYSANWPKKQEGSGVCSYKVKPLADTQFIRLDFLTLELEVKSSNCVHDRLTVFGGMEPSGNMCGVRTGEATLIEVDKNMRDIEVSVQTQSDEWRWNIKITQVSRAEVEANKKKMIKQGNARTIDFPCGVKNPSESNPVGKLGGKNKRKKPADINLPKLSSKKVFKKLEDLPVLDEFEKAQLQIYKPSFTKQVLDQSKTNIQGFGRSSLQKGRILYGNETDPNEYPWQISMWLDGNHFCGGTLIDPEWVVTAAHCVDMHYRKHFYRMTISLGDHDVSLVGETTSQVRKSIKKIFRFPTYDHNLIEGDLALVQLNGKVALSEKIRPACLPEDPEEDYGWAEALISGWGYTDKTKKITEDHPRPTTSKKLQEAAVYILPKDMCHKYSPFPISDRMICTYKGPYGVETTCQGDSGGPLVVNVGENKHVLVGATSFGVASCEGPYPSMFTRITAHLDFIYASMASSPLEEK